jgi:hypothetical protein
MVEKALGRREWSLLLYGAIGALVVVLPLMILGADVDGLLLAIIAAAIVFLVLLVIAIRNIHRQELPVLVMLALFFVASWLLFRVSEDVRTTGRWLFHSKEYKSTVLTQPASEKGDLKHVEFETWGFAGVGNTVVYVVFDPDDSLASAARNHSPGTYSGLPCEVVRVRRLENRWYSVLFYTDTDWDTCKQTSTHR